MMYVSVCLIAILVSSSLVFAVIIRYVKMSFNIPIDINAPLLIYGILVGLCCRLAKTNFNFEFPVLQPFKVYFIVVPIILYKMCFYADLHGLQRNIFQILLISGPGLIANVIFVGITIRYLLAKAWDIVACAIIGIACVVIYPKENISTMQLFGHQSQHISSLLEGETIFGMLVAFSLYNILLSEFKYLLMTPDFIIFILRYSLGGILVGFIVGKINCFLFRLMLMSSNVSNWVLFNIAMPLVSYYLCSFILGTSGLIAIVIYGLILDSKRAVLNKSLKILLEEYWELIGLTVESIISTLVGATIGYETVWVSNYLDYVRIVLIYCATYCGRFVIYAILAPLTSRLGYGMSLRSLVVAVWGGAPSLANICFIFLTWTNDESTEMVVPKILFYVSGMVIISLLLNVYTLIPLIKFLKMDATCPTRERELGLCMEYLKNIGRRLVTFLKVDDLMGETAWKTVETATTLRNPFEDDSNNSGGVGLDGNITFCSNCNQEIYVHPSHVDYIKMKRRANLRFLKTRETMLEDAYSKGLISENSFKTLNSIIKKAYEHPKYEMNIDRILQLFKKKVDGSRNKPRCPKASCFDIGTRDFPSKPPNFYWRRLCYHLVRNHNFYLSMLGILLANMAWILVQLCVDLETSGGANYALIAFDAMFLTIYTSECLVSIAARTGKSFCKDGLKNYFRSKYCTFDFCLLLTLWISFIAENLFYSGIVRDEFFYENRVLFMIFKSTILLRLFEYCIYAKVGIEKIVESWRNRRLLDAFEIGKDFCVQERRFLNEMLPYLCDDFRMAKDFHNEIERNIYDILHELRKIQYEKFWIAVTVKTKHAVKLTVDAMVEAVDNLTVSGWIDNMEQAALNVKLATLTNEYKRFKKIKDNDPESIFREVSWLKNQPCKETLLREAEIKVFNSGEVLFGEDDESEGIYVVTYMQRFFCTQRRASAETSCVRGTTCYRQHNLG
ncbi:sodium/hydrogen exchanger 10-like isoform X2 [Harmonia axyridis]|uniref:sodium/hydrogen exchanger 10-like isoform X2 n=1 Tax=Harmonia axyridis TaxID=115357 RepID=UPI001E277B2E|nr:sodium/hydrogen exchanger 10-like isoform X2 [Harmonia axyridis]